MTAKEIRAAVSSKKELAIVGRYECAFRGEGTRLHSCVQCGGRRKGVVYECSLHGECTVLSISARTENGKSRLPVCIACDDRVDNDGKAKANSNALLVDESRKLIDCVHFGSWSGTRHSAGASEDIYKCNCPSKPDHTSITDCHTCDKIKSRLGAAREYAENKGGAVVRVKKDSRMSRRELRAERKKKAVIEEGQRHPADVNPIAVYDRTRRPANIANLFYGTPIFICLSGPSLNLFNLDLLSQRGVLTMGVNNASAHMRTNIFIHGDPSKKFHDSIWKDPSVMKLTPKSMLKRDVRHRVDGELEIYKRVMYMPNVFGYNRTSVFNPNTFLTEDNISFGNGKRGVNKNGLPKVLSTMFSALKMAWHLGCKRAYLLGCDFNMADGGAYAFAQGKSDGASRSNNASYEKIAYLLGLAKPHFDEMGFEVFNCYRKSGLGVYPYMPYADAVASAVNGIEQEPNTEGWYEKRK